MTDLTIITNNRPRALLTWYDLTPREQSEFVGYLDDEDKQSSADFARYRGRVYDLGEFMRTPDDLKPFDGYTSDSFFSGVLCRFVDHGGSVVMGRYYS